MGKKSNRKSQKKGYTAPKVDVVSVKDLLESVGPVQGSSSGGGAASPVMDPKGKRGHGHGHGRGRGHR